MGLADGEAWEKEYGTAERGPLNPVHSARSMTFNYRNYAGEVSERTAHPIVIWYGETQFHAGQQWFMSAYDPSRGEDRDFAMADMVGMGRAKELGGREETMIFDVNGTMICVGDIVQYPIQEPFQEMHGTWGQYEVQKAPGGYRLSYWLSEKGAVLPKGYTAGYMSEHVMDMDDRSVKQMVFSLVPIQSTTLTIVGKTET